MVTDMDIRLTDQFEKSSFSATKTDPASYFTAAPSQNESDLKSSKAAQNKESVIPADLNDELLDDEYDLYDEEIDSLSTEEGSSAEVFSTLWDAPPVEEGKLLLKVQGLNQVYSQGVNDLHILNNVDLRIYTGEITALVGPSGSGKSTLLHILGLLDSPISGQVIMGGKDISQLNDRARTKLRNGHIGFVYQFHHLLPEFSAIENVALPLIIAGKKEKYAKDKAAIFLEHLGLGQRLYHRPATLSGGEQQRVAIARALINDPYLLFADEPTGNLDPETSEEVFELLLDLVHSRGIGALIATHNMDLARRMDRILEVKSGRVLAY